LTTHGIPVQWEPYQGNHINYIEGIHMKTNHYYSMVALRRILERRQAQRIAKGNPSASLVRAIEHLNSQIREY